MENFGAPQGAQNMQRITPQIIKDAKLLECSCGNKQFKENIIIKKISAIISPSGKEEYFPMNILICTECGLMPRELNRDNMIPEEYLTEK